MMFRYALLGYRQYVSEELGLLGIHETATRGGLVGRAQVPYELRRESFQHVAAGLPCAFGRRHLGRPECRV
jgi:hypothetical protein